jgi:multiple sugar transport system ATP-binding protein
VIDRGRLVQVGTPRDIYENPIDSYVATRLGTPRINMVARSLFPNFAAPAAAVTIGARTEHVHIRRSGNGAATGTVTWIEHLGDQNHLHVALAEGELVTLGDPDAGLCVGDRVAIEFTRPLFFDGNGRRVTQ